MSAHLVGTDDKEYVQYMSQTCVGFNNSVILLLLLLLLLLFLILQYKDLTRDFIQIFQALIKNLHTKDIPCR